MLKDLIKSGRSKALVISKQMLTHLGLEGDQIDVQYVENGIILSRPADETPVRAVGNLPQTAFEKFETNEQGW